MGVTESKYRVYIALFAHPRTSRIAPGDADLSRYHWAVWIEPKGARDTTPSHCFDVVLDGRSSTWQFRHDQSAQAVRSTGLVLRVMVGKLPRNVHVDAEIFQLLHGIPTPNLASDYYEEDAVTWVAEALLMLQEQGLVEAFDVPRMMQSAALVADRMRKERHCTGGTKINAVGNRKFP